MKNWPGWAVLGLFYGVGLFPASAFENPDRPAESRGGDRRFYQALERCENRLVKASARRPFKIKAMNDSLETTRIVLQTVLSGRISSGALALAKEAQEQFPENYFAVLLEALILDARVRQEQAHVRYQDYLDQSRKSTSFDAAFVSPVDYHELRRGVFELLRSRGLRPSLEGPGSRSASQTNARGLTKLLAPKGAKAVFLFLTGFGLVLALNRLFGANFSDETWILLKRLFALSWLALAVYLAGFYWDWPRSLTPLARALLALLVIPVGYAPVFVKRIVRLYGPAPSDSYRCPACREIYSKILLECPSCQTPRRD